MNTKKVELLAPAGSYESMVAAINAGADAVYIGGSKFGARAFAENPDEDVLLKAIDYAHLHGRQIYMTLNTLIKEKEFSELKEYLMPYYRQGVDAVIVQDLGVLGYIRKQFPDLCVHASTQMTITGKYGAAMLKDMGVSRVVTARELSLKEIETIYKETGMEIESFVHGALCYAYSGQCLFSSLIGGRSGNRGRCAQTCRLPFEVKREDEILNKKSERHVLSLKDLCALELIPEMAESGIFSMKIEGRMKSPRYTAGVVHVYRKYLDRYLEHGKDGYFIEPEDRTILQDLFNRGGQTQGYYEKHNGKDMVVWKEKPTFREANQELYDYLDETYVNHHYQSPMQGRVILKDGKPISLYLRHKEIEVSVSGEVPQAAKNQPITEEKLRKQLQKTGNSSFYFSQLDVEIEGDFFVPVQELNELRRQGLAHLEEEILKQFKRETILPVINQGQEIQKSEEQRMTLHVSLEEASLFEVTLRAKEVSRIYLESASFSPKEWSAYVKKCEAEKKECYILMPHIFREEAQTYFVKYQEELLSAGFHGALIRSLEEVGFLKKIGFTGKLLFDYSMYVMNQSAKEVMKEIGANGLTLPVELNLKELRALNMQAEMIVYGRIPMMVTAQCIRQGMDGCSKKTEVLYLKDRIGKEFPVKNHCTFCYNTIYNESPLSLLTQSRDVSSLRPQSLRLSFTTENKKEAQEVLQSFSSVFIHGEKVDQSVDGFTKGHFKRGIE